MQRRAEFRPFSWIFDLWKREQLDLSPPYQRRSVWPDRFRYEFVTTVLQDYPCPAIFLFEEIRPDGSFIYKVVDGKQRISTLISFVENRIEIDDAYPVPELRGRYFDSLDNENKLKVWRYSFSVEFIQQENETLINEIFNRINKNVAKLSSQELRHAKFSGVFITQLESISEETFRTLSSNFPNFAAQSKRQMKDIEHVANLLLFIEHGEKSLSQGDLDQAFADRDEEWAKGSEVIEQFRRSLQFVSEILKTEYSSTISNSRLRNQADFYSFFAAIVELKREKNCPEAHDVGHRLSMWLTQLREVERLLTSTEQDNEISKYLQAARAASNDAGPRRIRINAIKKVMLGH